MISAIDAHHHLWRYSRAGYGWIGDEMTVLQRNFLPQDLAQESSTSGVIGTVAVQARQTAAETNWLLSLAEDSHLIAGVVGWVDLRSPHFQAQLDELCAAPKLVGLRHVVQDEAAGFLKDGSFNHSIALLRGAGLVYDLLIREHQLAEAIQFVDRHPDQSFVLDHAAKPGVASGELEPWRSKILELGRRQNVHCKISGLVTEASWSMWSMTDLRPYIETLLEAFGAKRLMVGSDWPVCLLASSYSRWWSTVRGFLTELTEAEQQAILYGTAHKTYQLCLTI